MFAIDIDGDGDIDVLSASANDDTIAWYPNTDGAGTFVEKQIITDTADGTKSVFGLCDRSERRANFAVFSAFPVEDAHSLIHARTRNRYLG